MVVQTILESCTDIFGKEVLQLFDSLHASKQNTDSGTDTDSVGLAGDEGHMMHSQHHERLGKQKI